MLEYQVMAEDTQEILFRSSIRPQLPCETRGQSQITGEENHLLPSEPIHSYIWMASDTTEPQLLHPKLKNVILPDQLLGRSFLLDEDEEGQRHIAIIVKKIIEIYKANDKEFIKFLVNVPAGKIDQLCEYHDLLDKTNSQQSMDEDGNRVWKFINF